MSFDEWFSTRLGDSSSPRETSGRCLADRWFSTRLGDLSSPWETSGRCLADRWFSTRPDMNACLGDLSSPWEVSLRSLGNHVGLALRENWFIASGQTRMPVGMSSRRRFLFTS